MMTCTILVFFGLGLPEFLLILSSFMIIVGGTALWIWSLVDIARNEFRADTQKIFWVILVALTHFIGALIYPFVGRAQRVRVS